jgi:hypothetical protein
MTSAMDSRMRRWPMQEVTIEMSDVPALAAGRVPLDWVVLIGFPAAVALRLIVVNEVALGVALGGCIVLGAILVHFTHRGFRQRPFPLEGAPHGRD